MPTASGSGWPAVSAIIATRDRPELLAVAVESIFGQDYEGPIEVVVVFDQTPVRDVEFPTRGPDGPQRSIRVIANVGTAGLAGARNSGIRAAGGELIAFCDDDDAWTPDKLTLQVSAMRAADAIMSVGGIRIRYGDLERERSPKGGVVDLDHLARSRLTGAHPSTYVVRRSAMIAASGVDGPLGLVDEAIPWGYGEDYDLLLRAARTGKIAVVPNIVAEVLWHPGSYFSRRWEAMVDGLGYLLTKHPEIAADRRGVAWIQGQRAFALAASGRRGEAVRTAWSSIRHDPRQPRGLLALIVAARIVKPEQVMAFLNARGRGI